MKLDNYRQNVEAELIGMLIAIVAIVIVATGIVWAIVTMIRWWLV